MSLHVLHCTTTCKHVQTATSCASDCRPGIALDHHLRPVIDNVERDLHVPGHTLNGVARKLEQERISVDNQHILQRICNSKGAYSGLLLRHLWFSCLLRSSCLSSHMPSLLCSSALAAGGSATEEVCSDQESHCARRQPSRNKSECTQGQQKVQSRGDLQDVCATSYCSSWKQALLPQDCTHRKSDVSSSCSRETNDSSIDLKVLKLLFSHADLGVPCCSR